MSEIKRLRESAGLTQKEAADKLDMNDRTFGSYERGERTPDYKTMDRIRKVLGDGGSTQAVSQGSEHVRRVTLQHAGAGPGQAAQAEEEIVLDDRLFRGSGIDFDGNGFLRIQGSSLEPYLSHGQIVAVEHTEEVKGQDIYAFWRDDEEGYAVAIIDSTTEGLKIEKRGPDPSSTEWTHEHDDVYRSEDGRTARIRVLGRVLGAFSSPAKQMAERAEAARSAALALKV